MANMKEIKKRIKSVSDIKKITNAMYLTSSAKFTSGRDKLAKATPRFDTVNKQVGIISAFSGDNPFVKTKNGKVLCILIGGEKGLAGDFSKEIIRFYEDNKISENCELIVIGEAAKKICDGRRISYTALPDINLSKPDYNMALTLSEYICKRYLSEDISKAEIIYSEYKKQAGTPVKKQYLPVEINQTSTPDFAFYPDKKSLCDEVISLYLTECLYGIILKSYCSEQSARMTAMDNANKNAGELLDELTVKYNHIRQNSITAQITEISSAAGRNNQ